MLRFHICVLRVFFQACDPVFTLGEAWREKVLERCRMITHEPQRELKGKGGTSGVVWNLPACSLLSW